MDREEFEEKLAQNPNPVVVDIWAPWCVPCRTIAPSLDRLEEQYRGRVDVWKVNADENVSLVQSLDVRSIPTLITYSRGQEVSRRTGVQPPAVLAELFESGLTGIAAPKRTLASSERGIRMLVGAALFAVGWLTGPSWILLAISGVILFSAVYDRCPIWQALSPRLYRLFTAPLAPRGK